MPADAFHPGQFPMLVSLETHDLLAALRALAPGLPDLPPELRSDLAGGAQPVAIPEGEVLFSDGDPGRGLWLVTEGTIRVTRASADGRELQLYRVRRGETCLLSLSALLSDGVYAGTGVAETDVRGFWIPRELARRLVEDLPEFRAQILAGYARQVTGLLDLIVAVAFDRLDRRLAALLLRRIEESGDTSVEATHQRLADELGSVREIVSRILEEFAGRGVVRLGRKRIRVVDRARLARLAGVSDI